MLPRVGLWCAKRTPFLSLSAAQRAKSGEPSTTDGASFLPVVQVARTKAHAVSPKPGDVVTVRCTRLSQRTAVCEILTVGQVALRQKFTGIIKLQDVRAFETDSTVMAKCFRPGDIIRAEVVGLVSHYAASRAICITC